MPSTNPSQHNESLGHKGKERPFLIVLVEDDHDDTEFICDAIKQLVPQAVLQCFRNAFEFQEYLKEDNEATPSLFIFDFNLPIMSGLELLKAVQQNSAYLPVPKVIYTHSERSKERDACLAAGATVFLTKSNSFEKIKNDTLQMLALCYPVN